MQMASPFFIVLMSLFCSIGKGGPKCFPYRVAGRQWRFQLHPLARYGMIESQSPGMQVNGSVAIAAPGAVFHITFDRTTYSGQLRPNLMVAAGDELDVQ